MAVLPIVCGMAMAWFGEIQATWASTWVSLVCVVLQAAKTVLWSEMLTGEYKVGWWVDSSVVPQQVFVAIPTVSVSKEDSP